MTVRVFQFWSGAPATIREVELPANVVEENYAKESTHGTDGVRLGFLNAIFKYGQNEVQNQQAPSVSVGDIIELNLFGVYSFFAVASAGFEDYGREKHFMYSSTSRLGRCASGLGHEDITE